MAKKEFKAESKRLLDLMINSIYTHKEIFLRELISNASDAIDKLYFKSLTDHNVPYGHDDFCIWIDADKDSRTLKISDNGIGMTADELENNLGTIARSGSLEFKQENELKDDVDIIGQFGVGFYSAFMVSNDITVRSLAYGAGEAYEWRSDGVDGYTIEKCDKQDVGTEIILKIKENTETDNYDEFLEPFSIRSIVKKYSDYIRYPIKMNIEKHVQVESDDADKEPEYETKVEPEVLNSMVPLWKKNKSEVTDEEYNNFYREKFYDFEDPAKIIHVKTEGSATYSALLFIPSRAPFNYYSKEYEKGLQLYGSGVLITEKCAELLPDYFSFVKGIVDSEDLSLNISREMLQHDHQLKLIEKSIERKIKSELTKMLKNEREEYEKFYKNFGLQLKFGIYNNFGADKETLQDLVMFHSSAQDKLITLAEYVSSMKEDQKEIYYACGESVARINSLPQADAVRDRGYDFLCLTDDVDEFVFKIMNEYDGKPFKSISAGDLELSTDEEKKENEKLSEENRDLLDRMKEALDGKVDSVKISTRLKSHPVCLTSEGTVSLEMEKILSTMPGDQKVKATKVLEINSGHPIFETLKKVASDDPEKLREYAYILYNQSLLIDGLSIEDPVEFSNKICGLMSEKA